MRIDECKMLRKKLRKANNAFYNFQKNDTNKIATMALVTELLYENARNPKPYYLGKHHDALYDHMVSTYEDDICLIVKMDGNLHGYTRHDVASRCRAVETHMGKAPKQLLPLKEFMEEIEKAEVLFCIGLQFVHTPFILGETPVTDSTYFV